MALDQMSKARIAVHKSIAGELAGKLQAVGCCEFIGQVEGKLDVGAIEQLHSKQKHVNELLTDAKYLTRLLEPFETDKESSLSRMLGDIPQISLSDLTAKVDEEKFSVFFKTMRGKDSAMSACHSEKARLKGLLSQLKQLESIKWPLEFFTTGTDLVIGEILTVSKTTSDEFKTRISNELGDYLELQELLTNEKESNATFAILFRKSDFNSLQRLVADFSATRIDVPKEFKNLASDEKRKLETEIVALAKKEALLSSEIASRANEGLEMARYYSDYWIIIRDRLDSMLSGLPTDEVLIWSFWVPTKMLSLVEKTIKPYEDLTEFAMIEPEEGEIPPTLLSNPKWSSCVEPLTLMYGSPTYGKVDPSTLMAPFFFLFMGMCFGDAGYGLILSAIFGYILIKHRLSPTLRKFFILLTTGMLFSVFMGAITGSWFGDSITAFPFLRPLIPIKNAFQFLDPMNDPMTFLLISLALGFVHIIFGLVIAMVMNWREGDKTAAILDQGTWIFFLISLVVMGISMSGAISTAFVLPSKIASIALALLLIATQGRAKKNLFSRLLSGVLSLYDVTGYLGDVLSYSRLLALGLGSAAVGMVINLLGTLVADTPYVGIILAALIFIIGHTFSIVVNLLGAFVHSLRLQYVEFFGKFYDANGKDFAPLCNAPKFARLSEESTVH